MHTGTSIVDLASAIRRRADHLTAAARALDEREISRAADFEELTRTDAEVMAAEAIAAGGDFNIADYDPRGAFTDLLVDYLLEPEDGRAAIGARLLIALRNSVRAYAEGIYPDIRDRRLPMEGDGAARRREAMQSYCAAVDGLPDHS